MEGKMGASKQMMLEQMKLDYVHHVVDDLKYELDADGDRLMAAAILVAGVAVKFPAKDRGEKFQKFLSVVTDIVERSE